MVEGAFCPHFATLGALSAPTLLFWGRFLPPLLSVSYTHLVSNGFAPIIIATKLDKIKRSQRDKQLKLVRTGLGVLPGTKIIPFSAETKEGREEIWDLICAEPEHDEE